MILIVPYPPVGQNSSTIRRRRILSFARNCAMHHWWCSSQKFVVDTTVNSVSKPPQASRCTISNHIVAGGLVKFNIGYIVRPEYLTYCEKLRSLSYSF